MDPTARSPSQMTVFSDSDTGSSLTPLSSPSHSDNDASRDERKDSDLRGPRVPRNIGRANDADEPLLNPDAEGANKYVIYPIGEERRETWEWYKKHESTFWTAEELDFMPDVAQFPKLTVNERYYIAVTLAFFAASDGIVNENILLNLATEVQCPAARCFYGFQIAIENIHSEVYSLLIHTLIQQPITIQLDPNQPPRVVDQGALFHGIESFPSIRNKTDWALRWLNAEECTFAERLVAFACVEGIFFSSSFCSIFWLKTRHYQMTGLFTSNEFISRDEGLHRDFACFLYTNRLRHRLPQDTVRRIVGEAVDTEIQFVRELLPVRLIGMNEELMIQYVRFVADHLLAQLECDKLYNVANPFDWMESISIDGKTNFFEQRVSEYSKAGVGLTGEDQAMNCFSLEEDF